MLTEWSETEIKMAAELIVQMTATEAAAILTEKTGRTITKSALIGRLFRSGKKVEKFYTTRAKNAAPRVQRQKSITLPLPVRHPTPRLDIQQRIDRALSKQFTPLPPRYQPKATCQYIDDNNHRCEAVSQGPWCDHHKAIVFKPR